MTKLFLDETKRFHYPGWQPPKDILEDIRKRKSVPQISLPDFLAGLQRDTEPAILVAYRVLKGVRTDDLYSELGEKIFLGISHAVWICDTVDLRKFVTHIKTPVWEFMFTFKTDLLCHRCVRWDTSVQGLGISDVYEGNILFTQE